MSVLTFWKLVCWLLVVPGLAAATSKVHQQATWRIDPGVRAVDQLGPFAPDTTDGNKGPRLLSTQPGLSVTQERRLNEGDGSAGLTTFTSYALADLGPSVPGLCSDIPYSHVVQVSSADELHSALLSASAGVMVVLAPGTYSGAFSINEVQGNGEMPFTLCSAQGQAVLEGTAVNINPPVLWVTHSSHVNIFGVVLTNSPVGLLTDSSHNMVISNVEVYSIGQEGVHFRDASTNNEIRASTVRDVGLINPQYGEGVYIGSASSKRGPDYSTDNWVTGNTIGPGVTAELVELKEYVSGCLVEGNTLNGSSLSGLNGADSWVDIKGNSNIIRNNLGYITNGVGFSTSVANAPDSGSNNVFEGNTAACHSDGYAFYMDPSSSGNTVSCLNTYESCYRLTNINCA